MRTIGYTHEARAEIAEAVEYLDRFSPAAAHRLSDEIDRRCHLLASQPGIGRPRDDLGPGVRSVVVQRYLLFYTHTDTALVVIRFLYGSRDLPAAFGKDQPSPPAP